MASVLAPRHRVLLLDRREEPDERVGESLIPAARRLLKDMRLLDAMEAGGHAPYLGNRAFWGGTQLETTDFLSDPDGSGWHIDRAGFESFLRNAALSRGAKLKNPARVCRLSREHRHWKLGVRSKEGQTDFRAHLIVDACGRSSSIAKRLGAKRENTDKLIACWSYGENDSAEVEDIGFSTVESAHDGWWYSASVPHDGDQKLRRILAFHTDRDLLQPRRWNLEGAFCLPGLGPILDRSGFRITGPMRTTAANTAYLKPSAGDGWLAIGDASISFDPLASRGLFNALYTAMSGAMACHDFLEHYSENLAPYLSDLNRINQAYRRQLAYLYSSELRWCEGPFWRRRREGSINSL